VKELQIEKRPENHIFASAPLLPKFGQWGLLRGITNFGSRALTQGNTAARRISRATWLQPGFGAIKPDKDGQGDVQVKPAPFAYAKARSLDHAIALLDGTAEAKILAGGQSLMPALNMRLSAPSLLIDINGISELGLIAQRNGQLELGALVRHVEIENSPEVARLAPLLGKAVPHIAHPAIRNRGTIGGSIAFADPAAELPACLLALGGEIEIAGRAGKRSVAADAFFKGLFETALVPGEIITAIRIPAAQPQDQFGFAELARRLGDYALVGLAAATHRDGTRKAIRLAYFGVGTTPVRARTAEAALADGNLDAAVAALAGDLEPSSDVHASAAAKQHLAGVLLRRVAAQLSAS
jgi:aerobic carbon-monoxide dehydrogenase medium subunit